MCCFICYRFWVLFYIVWIKGLVSGTLIFEMCLWLLIVIVFMEILWFFFFISGYMMVFTWIVCFFFWINILSKICLVEANMNSGNLSGVYLKCKKCYSVVGSRFFFWLGVTLSFFFGGRTRRRGRAV